MSVRQAALSQVGRRLPMPVQLRTRLLVSSVLTISLVVLLVVIDEQAMLDTAAALGPKIIVLKRAERGALALADGVRYEAPAVPVAHVVDPVGAGDGFDAGFLAGLLRGNSITEALSLGALVGAGSVAALGDYGGYPRA